MTLYEDRRRVITRQSVAMGGHLTVTVNGIKQNVRDNRRLTTTAHYSLLYHTHIAIPCLK